MKGSSGGVPAVDQVARILAFLARAPGGRARLKDVCEGTGMHRSRVYSILSTLQRYGLVHKDPHSKTYRLGPGLIYLGRKAEEVLDVSEASLPFLRKLARETSSTAFLGIISGNYIFVAEKCDGSSPMGITIEKGRRFPLAMGAHGKSILSFLPKEERERILKEGKAYLHGPFPNSLNPVRLEREIKDCRNTGYSIDPGDIHPGICAVSSPIFDFAGSVVGAVVVVGTFPEGLAYVYGPKVREAAESISKALGYTKESPKEVCYGQNS